jgi:hypothetical protein
MVRCDADDRCHTVVKACRAKSFHVAATLTSNRSLCKHGWKLTAGRDGQHQCRRHRTAPLALVKPHGAVRDRDLEAGWRHVSKLGARQVVCSRHGTANKLLGLVTDAPAVSAAGLIQAYDRRWEIAPWLKDPQP